jgi:hypothetical protein
VGKQPSFALSASRKNMTGFGHVSVKQIARHGGRRRLQMNEQEEMENMMFKLVGNTTPGAPVEKIYVSEFVIAQMGIKEVKKFVRRIYRNMWKEAEDGTSKA